MTTQTAPDAETVRTHLQQLRVHRTIVAAMEAQLEAWNLNPETGESYPAAGVEVRMSAEQLAAAVAAHEAGTGLVTHRAALRQTANPHRPVTTYAACDGCSWTYGLMLPARREWLLSAIADHNAQAVGA